LLFIYFIFLIFFFQFVKTPGDNVQTTHATAAADSTRHCRVQD